MSTGDDARVVYEVSLDLDASIADAYRAWLDAHVREILALPGFIDGRVSEVIDPAAAEGRVGLCVHYTLRDAAVLDDYLREHAPRMRAEGQARFGGRFLAQRRVMRVVSDVGVR
ncbi:DUF4286 family protein [Lysobacter panacisoli]|uniref:DUF4286 family protein n=1 Tax=Lysobacter panacisoli TaxID=1255263 RepID=A0ABP9L0G1_9GAMM|nr:DUF4286 family protein [Lysobacter panacisoli]